MKTTTTKHPAPTPDAGGTLLDFAPRGAAAPAVGDDVSRKRKPGNGTAKAAAIPATCAPPEACASCSHRADCLERPTATARLGTQRSEMVALGDIAEPEWSGRLVTNAEKDAELLASVREVGVIQPICVRPRPPAGTAAGRSVPYERVVGSRRMQAARQAGLPAILAVVRELTDRQVAIIQAIENDQRLDVHALEQAETYRRMRDVHGMKPEEIAREIGKSRTWVYDRLRLGNLEAKPRAACLKGELEVSTAFLLSRWPQPIQGEVWAEMQREAQRPNRPVGDDGLMSYRAVQELLRRDYQLDLKRAPFATADAQLVPAAGACSSCPKRTGNDREVFPEADIKSPDVCTDRGCYRKKLEQCNAQRELAHKAAGGKVLQPNAGAKLFQRWSHGELEQNSDYRDLDATYFDSHSGKPKRYREALAGTDQEVVLARDPDGQLHELVDRKVADKAVQTAARARQKTQSEQQQAATRREENAREKADRERRQRAEAFRERFTTTLGVAVGSAAAKAASIPTEAWRVLLLRSLECADPDALNLVARRRRLIADGAAYGKDQHELEQLARKGDAALLRSVLFELIATEVTGSPSAPGKLAESLCTAFGVDPKAIRKQVAEQMQQEVKAAKLGPPHASPRLQSAMQAFEREQASASGAKKTSATSRKGGRQ